MVKHIFVNTEKCPGEKLVAMSADRQMITRCKQFKKACHNAAMADWL